MTDTVIFSCHASSTGKAFQLERDITFYCVNVASLENSTAYVLLCKLRKLNGICDDIPDFWKTEVENQREEPLVDVYNAGKEIPDYELSDLEKVWEDDTGLFAFSNGTPLLENFGEGKLLSKVLVNNPEITSVFWLACNA
jgi:hypothetical protein